MTRRLPILTFHSIDDSGSPISLTPVVFRRLMENLASAGWTGCRLDEAVSPTNSEGALRFGVCFDDGYRNVIESAAPVLRDLGFSATVFAIAGRCGEDNQWPGQASWVPTMGLMDWRELATLCDAGWEIGSHGWGHSRLTSLEPARLLEELRRSRTSLEERLDTSVGSLAYPYGASSTEVVEAARSVYQTAFSTRLAVATEADLADGFDLPRVDAFYLRRWPAGLRLDSPPARAYLAVRRLGRRLRAGAGQ